MNDKLDRVRRVLEGAGLGWLLQDDVEVRCKMYLEEMAEMDAWLAERGVARKRSFLEEAEEDPEATRAVVQTFAVPMTTPIRGVAYLVADGADIRDISFEYRDGESVCLKVAVAPGSGRRPVVQAESTEVWDVEFLRHLSIMKMGDQPLLSGYYALRTD